MSDQDQIVEAPIQVAADDKDMGCHELANSQTLKQVLKNNVQKADTFMHHLETARVNTQQSVDALEAQYLSIAEKLTGKIEEQHRQQLERIESEKRTAETWLREYVDEIRKAKQQVKMDPFERMKAEIEQIKQAQLDVQDTVLE